MGNVYFDEAGNTGPDLLHKDQPVFVLAANCLEEDKANELIKILAIQNGSEAKFKNLKNSERGKRKTLEFLSEVIKEKEKAKVTIYHKKYMAMGLLLDFLVEPLYAAQGRNFAANKRNIWTTNVFFYMLDLCYGVGTLDNLLTKFIELVKETNQASINDFYSTVRNIEAFPLDAQRNLDFSWILGSEAEVEDHLEFINKNNLDPVQSGIFTHAQYWESEFNGPFKIIHDESNSLEQSLDYFNKFTLPDSVPFKAGTDDRIISLPLKVKKVSIQNSKLVPQIQVSDNIAGATAYYFKQVILGEQGREKEKLFYQLQEVGIESLLVHLVWPELKFTPEQYGITQLESEFSMNIADQIAFYQINEEMKRKQQIWD
ncbi:DUF3800 domain-containing protein [Acinetobacter baumannii]